MRFLLLKRNLVWHGFIIIREGLYQTGKFKFVIQFLENFPQTIPTIIFKNQILHPYIDPQSNKLDLKVNFFNRKLIESVP